MMFMMTIAPTTNPMAGSAVPKITIFDFRPSKNAIASACVSSAKLSGLPGGMRRDARSTSRATSMPSTTKSAVGACTTML
jgi:hypothetical protein